MKLIRKDEIMKMKFKNLKGGGFDKEEKKARKKQEKLQERILLKQKKQARKLMASQEKLRKQEQLLQQQLLVLDARAGVVRHCFCGEMDHLPLSALPFSPDARLFCRLHSWTPAFLALSTEAAKNVDLVFVQERIETFVKEHEGETQNTDFDLVSVSSDRPQRLARCKRVQDVVDATKHAPEGAALVLVARRSVFAGLIFHAGL